MREKKKDKVGIGVVVPKGVKEEIVSFVKHGEYKSISDFLRKAIYKLLDEKAAENEDVLGEKSFKRFIEEIS
ncbi:MAG: hypothetical protein ACE5HH_00850 [Candidatus Hydrothermarchaeales archaeon]